MRTLGLVAAVGAGLMWALGSTPGAGVAAPRAALQGGGGGGGGGGGSTVTGKVKLVGKAPANPPVDMSEEAKCQAKYTTPPRDMIVSVNATGALANVFVYVKAGL